MHFVLVLRNSGWHIQALLNHDINRTAPERPLDVMRPDFFWKLHSTAAMNCAVASWLLERQFLADEEVTFGNRDRAFCGID